jgi:tetratricopeptide (TPR) repeat protein
LRIIFVARYYLVKMFLFGSFTGLVLTLIPICSADQNAPELNRLFDRLKFAQSGSDARIIENHIWRVWFKTPDKNSKDKLFIARQNVQQGNLSGAQELLDEIIHSHPEYAEAWNQRAIVKFLSDDLEGSLYDIEQTLHLEPRHFGALSGRGQCLLRLRRYREALASYREALAINPQNHSIKRHVFLLEEQLGKKITPI